MQPSPSTDQEQSDSESKGKKSKMEVEVVEEESEDVSTFESLGLHDALLKAVSSVGYKKPTDIQKEAIPVSISGRDVIGLGETGSGKTAAFVLPILHDLLSLERPLPFAGLVLAPTRELAIQISDTFRALGSGIGLVVATLVGGIDMQGQVNALAKNPHVIVGTPGRVVDHLKHTKGISFKNIRHFVLDEADRLLNMDFEEEINIILKQLPKERRSYLFSATMTTKVKKLQRASLSNPVKIEVGSKYQTVSTLSQSYLFIPRGHKDTYLVFLLVRHTGKSTIVFSSTCLATQRLAYMLRILGFGAVPLHGQMSQPDRLGALNKFKAGDKKTNILIATDVASRGLDIPHVDLVVNYDMPTHSKDYIHRVGRTARAGRTGVAVNLVSQYDVEIYQRIEHLLEFQLPKYECEESEVLLLLDRVSEAQRQAAIKLKEKGVGKRGRKHAQDEMEDDDDEQEAMGGSKWKRVGGDKSKGRGRGKGKRRR